MMEESIGFEAKAPIGLWNKRIGVDTPGLFRASLKATLAFFTNSAPGAIGAAIDATSAFKLQPLPPAELAWLLIRRALARAMAELTVEAAQRHGADLRDKDGLVAALDQALDATEIWIDPGFFDRPAESAIVEAVHAPFVEWLSSLGLSPAEAESVQPRFGAYVTFALRREWAGHAENYAPVDAEIAKYENRFAKADERERAWLRHAAYLQRQINEPVFEESFGLAQIYVPLRACYAEPHDGSPQEAGTVPGGPQQLRIVVNLRRHLIKWLNRRDPRDAIRAICGGPGSGKSSFARMFAAELARNGQRVLYVPLHRITLREEMPDVQATLTEFLRDRDVLPHDPLDGRTGERHLIILFDGLDELAMQGRAGQEVARSFVEALIVKLGNLNDPSRDRQQLVQVILGGRDIAVQAVRLPADKVLHVLPYHGSDPDEFHAGQKMLKRADRGCHCWWQKYGTLTGESYTGLPEGLQSEQLKDITAQPLLNYLLALSYRRGQLDFSLSPSRNEIYRDLLDAVYERPWGEDDHPAKRQLTKEEFQDLLDELGLTARHGEGRTVTETTLMEACARAGLSEQLERFKEGAKAGAIGLLAAFYFRQAGRLPGGERTFEFTHKSFGEYLAARRVVRWMEDIHEERTRNRSNRQRGWSIDDSLLRWIEITGPTAPDLDLVTFLEREIGIQDRKQPVVSWQTTFAELLSDQLEHGLPLHRLLDRVRPSTFLEMTRRASNAERFLSIALNACGRASGTVSLVKWPHNRSFSRLYNRCISFETIGGISIEANGGSYYAIEFPSINRIASLLDVSGQSLERCLLSGADFTHSVLRQISAGGIIAHGATFNNTCLEGAFLTVGSFLGASFENANMKRALLVYANLGDARLIGADLQNATLSGANLRGANLCLANLRGASLVSANLVGVRGLDEALGLDEVARWDGARIERKWVGRLGLDAEKLGLEVVDDLEDGTDDGLDEDQPAVE